MAARQVGCALPTGLIPTLNPNHLAAVGQGINAQVDQRGASVAAVVTESAVAAAEPPVRLLLPLAAGAYAIRTIVLALEIVIRTDAHQNMNTLSMLPVCSLNACTSSPTARAAVVSSHMTDGQSLG